MTESAYQKRLQRNQEAHWESQREIKRRSDERLRPLREARRAAFREAARAAISYEIRRYDAMMAAHNAPAPVDPDELTGRAMDETDPARRNELLDAAMAARR